MRLHQSVGSTEPQFDMVGLAGKQKRTFG